ncbi:MAG: helix-turn-helix transcriptional regulator [Verrucomicrobia bacterium]|nr:helix-turn-helix transcriptional regulator [Verrucomicrobiota bacterium]
MPRTRAEQAYDYAAQLCARVPACQRALRAARGVKKEHLVANSGVARSMVYDVEKGESIPSLFVVIRMAHGMGLTFAQWAAELERGPRK